MSGHSKWSKIKHKKSAEDEKKAKNFSKLSKLITLAAREGGQKKETNSQLRIAIEKAKFFNLPQEKIERAIKRGTGEEKSVKLESALLEVFGPDNIFFLIDVVTDNKKRSISEIRKIVESFGAKIANRGVLWHFEKKGIILIKVNSKNKEKIELLLIDLGVDDFFEKNNNLKIYLSPQKMDNVKKGLFKNKIEIENSSIELVSKEKVEIDNKEAKKRVKEFFEALENHEDVQGIYSNFEE